MEDDSQGDRMQVLGTIFGIFIVDRIGRRRILIQSSIQTFLAELVLGIVFAISVDAQTTVVSGVPAISSIVLVRRASSAALSYPLIPAHSSVAAKSISRAPGADLCVRGSFRIWLVSASASLDGRLLLCEATCLTLAPD